ncbi:MAG: glycosyltransferase family 39 protein [Acidobacteriota bacterium]|nr:glycosyltransferase family 39 protein [Acidobacteriota bacterium]
MDVANDDPASPKSSLILFALAVALYVAARLWRLTASCLWFDEIFGVHAARHDWRALIDFVAADIIHPPLFYILLKIWIAAGGETLLWLRLFPALTAVAAIVPFVLLCRELRLKTSETNLALLLLAVNGYLIKYAQEVRMYSLMLFFALCSLWLFARFINRKSDSHRTLAALTLVNLLLVYTHYFGGMLMTIELLFLLWRARRKAAMFLTSIAGLVLCYVPWIAAVIGHAPRAGALEQNLGWAARPGVFDVLQFFALLHEIFYYRQSSHEPVFLSASAALGVVLLILPALLLLWRAWKREPPEDTTPLSTIRFLLFFALTPIALAFTFSQFLPQSIWGTRHLSIVAAPYLTLIAVALHRLRPAWMKAVVIALLCCWALVAGMLHVTKRAEIYVWCAWEPLAGEVLKAESSTRGEVKIYAFEDLVAYHLWFGLDATGETRFRVAVVKDIPGLVEDRAYFLPRRFNEIEVTNADNLRGDYFWLAFRDAAWDMSRPPLKTVIDKGYRVGVPVEIVATGGRAFIVPVRR